MKAGVHKIYRQLQSAGPAGGTAAEEDYAASRRAIKSAPIPAPGQRGRAACPPWHEEATGPPIQATSRPRVVVLRHRHRFRTAAFVSSPDRVYERCRASRPSNGSFRFQK